MLHRYMEKINAIFRKKMFNYLFLYTTYHHMSAQKQVTFPAMQYICTQCNTQSGRIFYLLHMCDILGLLTTRIFTDESSL